MLYTVFRTWCVALLPLVPSEKSLTAPQMVVVVGISFNLIIIRVDQGIAVGETYVGSTHLPSIPLHFRSSEHAQQDRTVGTGMQVLVTSVVDQEREPSEFGKDTTSVVSTENGPKAHWGAV
jgi:hypothetical protein